MSPQWGQCAIEFLVLFMVESEAPVDFEVTREELANKAKDIADIIRKFKIALKGQLGD